MSHNPRLWLPNILKYGLFADIKVSSNFFFHKNTTGNLNDQIICSVISVIFILILISIQCDKKNRRNSECHIPNCTRNVD